MDPAAMAHPGEPKIVPSGCDVSRGMADEPVLSVPLPSSSAASAPSSPAAGPAAVFVDLTGRRSRWVTGVGVVLASLLIVYVVAVLSAVLVADPVPDGALPPVAGSPWQPATGTIAPVQRCFPERCTRS